MSGPAAGSFWWVRHGPTHEKAFCGWRDVPADLSDQAALARLAAALPAAALLVSSDLRRARSTADAIAGGRVRLPDEPALREFDFGAWDGLGFAEVAAIAPGLSRRYWTEPGEVAPPGGESWNAAALRVAGTVARLRGAHPGRDIVVVAHIGVILTQLGAALGQTPAEAIAQEIAPLSLTRIGPKGPGDVGPVNFRP